MVDKTAGTHEESEKAAVAVYFLDTVEKAADHVMAAGCLTAGKDHADIDRLACSGGGVLFETDFRKTVGVGEQFADSFRLLQSGILNDEVPQCFRFHVVKSGVVFVKTDCCSSFPQLPFEHVGDARRQELSVINIGLYDNHLLFFLFSLFGLGSCYVVGVKLILDKGKDLPLEEQALFLKANRASWRPPWPSGHPRRWRSTWR